MQSLQFQTFQSRKESCLSKRDRSSAGRIDPKVVNICAAINERNEYYTTSSCAGRCFLYCGDGIKSHHHFAPASKVLDGDEDDKQEKPSGHGFFYRFRVSHDIIRDAKRYFNLSTLNSEALDFDPSGGGDPVRIIGQYDYKLNAEDGEFKDFEDSNVKYMYAFDPQIPLWLRYEPFILHVMCRSLSAAHALMKAARPAFKNVGLTSWKDGDNKYIVAIWGDEGIDMPLTTPAGRDFLFRGHEEWLKELVNERHLRNWGKIDRFLEVVRSMPIDDVDAGEINSWIQDGGYLMKESNDIDHSPRRYDVIGDVAQLHSIPGDISEEEIEKIGQSIMSKNKNIKVVALRSDVLSGTERSPGDEGLRIIAGARRSPLITTHTEYGIKCVVDLNNTFFSVRMAPERIRICQQVARGENVLALFCGVGMDAMQIAGRTEATVLAVELNPIAAECARRGHRMLIRNKGVKCQGAADRLKIIEGDALKVMNNLEPNSFDRILAPRPKEGAMDGDQGQGDGGLTFLRALLPLLKNQGECHWYDFASDSELPQCERTRASIKKACDEIGVGFEVIAITRCGSIAKRQMRICMDFRVIKE